MPGIFLQADLAVGDFDTRLGTSPVIERKTETGYMELYGEETNTDWAFGFALLHFCLFFVYSCIMGRAGRFVFCSSFCSHHFSAASWWAPARALFFVFVYASGPIYNDTNQRAFFFFTTNSFSNAEKDVFFKENSPSSAGQTSST